MHTFQKITPDIMEINPFEKIGKDWMLVTAGNEEKANTMTASWGALGQMWGKDAAFVVIRQSRFTKEFIDREKKFSLSFPSEAHKNLMKYLGAVSGRDEDKIKESRLHVGYMDGVPYIDEGNMIMTCRVMSRTPVSKEDYIDESIDGTWYASGDYHKMYIAEITGLYLR